MVDNPDKLCQICIRKFADLLQNDQIFWKKQIEQAIDQIYRTNKNHFGGELIDQKKRKFNLTNDENIDFNIYEVKFIFKKKQEK